MNTRLLVVAALVLLVVSGLIAGLFAGSIQNALTLPMMQSMMGMGNTQAKGPAVQPTKAPAVMPTMPAQNQNPPDTVLAQDTFNRTDQALWGVASDGRTWTGDANKLPNFSITGAAGRIANGAGTFNALLGPASTNVQVSIKGAVNRFTANGAVNLGVVVRWNSNDNWYKALIDGGHLSILKRVNGTTTTLISVPFTAQAGVVYSMRFRAVGAMLFTKAWRSDTAEPANWMATTSDTAFTTGQTGIRTLTLNTSIVTIKSYKVIKASTDIVGA